jgi:KipI family sensor histidine kinase inhibitor
MTSVQPLGDFAFLVDCEDEDRAAGLFRAAHAIPCPGLVDLVLAYRSLAVYLDPAVADPRQIEEALRTLIPDEMSLGEIARTHRIPVLYDGPDLAEVADRLGLAPGDVVAQHTELPYRVYAIGFQPGFPYAGYLPASLRGLPRKTTPRTRVSAGSVAIAGRQTAIYPSASPGGWHLLGQTPLSIVDPASGWFPIAPGDGLVFESIDAETFQSLEGTRLGTQLS